MKYENNRKEKMMKLRNNYCRVAGAGNNDKVTNVGKFSVNEK